METPKQKAIREAFKDRSDEHNPNKKGLLPDKEIQGDGLWLLTGNYEKVWIRNKLYWRKINQTL